MAPNPAALARLDADVAEQIARLGWFAIGVFGDKDGPPFTYTIGMAAHGGSEFLISGTNSPDAHALFEVLHVRLAEGWRPPDDPLQAFGRDDLGLEDDYLMAWPMSDDHEANFARRYWHQHGEAPWRCVQIVLADNQARFPFRGADADWTRLQVAKGTVIPAGWYA